MFRAYINSIVVNHSLKIFVDFSRYCELIQPIESPRALLVCFIPWYWKLPAAYSLCFFDMTHMVTSNNRAIIAGHYD